MKKLFLLFGLLGSFVAFGQGENLSQNKPVVSGSIFGEGYEDYLAVDGFDTTRFASGGAEGEQWIYVDLQAICDIDSVTILWEAAYGADFTVDVSDDAESWTTVETFEMNEPNLEEPQVINDLATSGRFVRINVTNGPHAHISIWEFVVYGTAGVPFNLLSFEQPVTSSGIYGEGYEDVWAVDWNDTTRFASDGTSPYWISVDLEDEYSIDSIVVNWEASFAAEYTIEVSDDGESWTTIVTVTGNDAFGPVSFSDLGEDAHGRHVRLNATVAGNGLISIWEFSVFGGEYVPVVEGLESNSESAGIKVYPNPVSDVFTVETENSAVANLSVYDLSGRLVYSDVFSNTKVINASEIAATGMLLIKVETENNTYFEKLVVK